MILGNEFIKGWWKGPQLRLIIGFEISRFSRYNHRLKTPNSMQIKR